jgi:lipopolysaccharide export system protein LptA
MTRHALAIALILIALPGLGLAQQQPQAKKKNESALGFNGNSKEPIQIDADRLEVFNKEQRAVYTGNVVAVQGETTVKSPVMIVYFERQNRQGEGAAATPAAAPAAGSGQGSGSSDGGTSLRRVEAKGGVTVVSKDQVATGNEGVFDRATNKIILTGNVALSQGENVTKGEKLTYDTETGVALVESSSKTRVRGFFVPGNEDEKTPGKKQDKKPDQKPKN